MYMYCVLLLSFVLCHASTSNKTQPAEKMKNVDSDKDASTLKSMKPIQFLNSNCYCMCAICIILTAFMYLLVCGKNK